MLNEGYYNIINIMQSTTIFFVKYFYFWENNNNIISIHTYTITYHHQTQLIYMLIIIIINLNIVHYEIFINLCTILRSVAKTPTNKLKVFFVENLFTKKKKENKNA